MSEADLEQLGDEVGIARDHIRQALAEERTRVAVQEEHGFVGSWFGASLATASRVVSGAPADLLAQLDGWMAREEALRVRRRFTDRLTWEVRRDFLSTLQTNFNFGGRPYALTSASEVGATAVAIDATRTLVRVDADFSTSRRRHVMWSAITAGGVALGSLGVTAIVASIPGGSVPIAAAAGAMATGSAAVVSGVIAAAQRRHIARAQLALEQILDRLEHGELTSRGSSLLDLFGQATR
jgi:hypothetical protein